MVTLEIRLLGEFAMFYKGAPLTGLNGTRAQSLLAYLLLHRDAPVTRQRLAFLFWPDSAEAQARTNLRSLLHNLLQSLPESERFVQAEAQTVQWRPDGPFSLDVDSFRTAVKQADSTEELQAAVALYAGDLLPECYDDWIAPERERLAEIYRNALQRLVDLLEKQGAYPEAIHPALCLARHDPLRENVWRQIMRLQALNGDRAGVARAYRECTTVLKRELDVEPSAETAAAFEKWKRYVAPAAGAAVPGPGPAAAPGIPVEPADPPAAPDTAAARYVAVSGSYHTWQASRDRGGDPRAWQRLSRATKLAWVGVILLMAGVLAYGAYNAWAVPPIPPVLALRGCMGGSKAGLMNDPDVQRILLERYKLQVTFDTMGSRDMVTRCASGYDFVWPGTEADVERFRQLLGPDLTYETPLNSALVLYSWAEVTDALLQQGVVEEKDGVYYVADTAQLLNWLIEDKEFKAIGLPQLYGHFVILPTDPTKSESGGIFAVYLTSMLLGGDVPDVAASEQVLPQVHAYFEGLGFLEQSTGKLFDRFLRAGPGDKPIIVAYESQGIERIALDPQREQILKKLRIIYPRPTVWVSHPLIALTPGGKALLRALADEEIQAIAWQKHGFRSGVAGIQSRPEDLLPARVPASIDSILALPQPAVMDRIVDELGH